MEFFSNFFFQAEDGIRGLTVTGVQTCALPILNTPAGAGLRVHRRPRAERRGGPRDREIGRASCRERVQTTAGSGRLKTKAIRAPAATSSCICWQACRSSGASLVPLGVAPGPGG